MKKYSFKQIENCNMCNSPVATHKLLGKRLNGRQGIRPKRIGGISVSVYKCNNCGLIYSNPMPIPDNIQDHYGLPPESYWNKQNFEMPQNYFAKELDQLKLLIGDLKGKKALDIGAGLGMAMVAMQQQGMDVHGIEASEPFYERAIEKMKISKERLKLASIEETEYEHNSFDFVNFAAVLEHFYDPSACILKAMSWLKPGGVVFIEVPSSKYLVTKLINVFYKFTGADYVSNISPMHVPFHLHEFVVESFIKNSAVNNNLYSIPYYKYEPNADWMPGSIKKLVNWYMKKNNRGMQLCIYLKKN